MVPALRKAFAARSYMRAMPTPPAHARRAPIPSRATSATGTFTTSRSLPHSKVQRANEGSSLRPGISARCWRRSRGCLGRDVKSKYDRAAQVIQRVEPIFRAKSPESASSPIAMTTSSPSSRRAVGEFVTTVSITTPECSARNAPSLCMIARRRTGWMPIRSVPWARTTPSRADASTSSNSEIRCRHLRNKRPRPRSERYAGSSDSTAGSQVFFKRADGLADHRWSQIEIVSRCRERLRLSSTAKELDRAKLVHRVLPLQRRSLFAFWKDTSARSCILSSNGKA